jgi:hypothetical protein
MKLQLSAQRAFLSNVNARAEMKGEEREPAADLAIRFDTANDILANFSPSLKSLLYYFDDARPADLADQGKAAEPGYAPHLRYPMLDAPIKWNDEMLGAECRIQTGNQTLFLRDVKVNAFKFTPKDGGTVTVEFRVQAHPDEKSFGKLCTMIQTEVEISIDPNAE